MERKNRQTLKSYFQKGDVPTEQQFAELIDSVPNIEEDGQAIRTKDGWSFYPETGGNLNIRLHAEEGGAAVWTLSLTPGKRLAVCNVQGDPVVELAQDKTVTLHGKTVRDGEGSEPSAGDDDYKTLPADKQWHALSVDLSREGFGCRVFNIYAAFRNPDMGLNKLTCATALWQDFAANKIKSPQKHWWGWSGGVKIRWKTVDKKLQLQLRSKHASEKGAVHYKVVEVFKG